MRATSRAAFVVFAALLAGAGVGDGVGVGAGAGTGNETAHWAYVPAVRQPVPAVARASWPRGAIDSFVLARLEREGLAPVREADREMLLRRVTFDLTGLPPTAWEIDAFLDDDAPDAYDNAVDRLLASPRFGERMAVPWLDAARYADSYGYQSDQLSPTWPYRDWVVRAYNRNLPYDEFLSWQLAGDLLPDASRDQKLATAFNRLHRMTNEGGSIPEEWLNEYAADRLHTFGTAFLGLTLECARCHDHKYDPISDREYYGLYAFFNSIDEWGMYNDSARVPTPALLLPTPAETQSLDRLEATLDEAETTLRATAREREAAFGVWLTGAADLEPVLPGLVGDYPLDAIEPEHRLLNRADAETPGSTAPANTIVEGHTGGALRFTGDDEARFPKVGGGLNPWEAFSIAFWLFLPDDRPDCIIVHRSGGTDVGRHGFELSLREGRAFLGLLRFWPGNALAVESTERLPTGAWTHVALTWDASGQADGLRLYFAGRPVERRILRDRLTKSPGAGGDGMIFGARFRDAGLAGGAIDELAVFDRAIAPIEVAHLAGGDDLRAALAARDAAALRPYYDAAIDEPLAAARRARASALHELYTARDQVVEIPVMEERSAARDAFVLARGAYDAPKTAANRVARGTPAALPPMPADAPRDRLGLARWATDPRHPLTARVAVNRTWQTFFGRGLVVTSENFGFQGASPSHPALLDWLAVDFVASGWDFKRLCRMIVTSATYRQRSALRPDLAERDPANELLARRGPARRLTAEMLRDQALAASGLLDDSQGGPPVSPYQPAGLWRESNTMSPAYRQSVGTALYRRSLYTVWKRTAPPPGMMTFDAATREVRTVRRETTSSPLQALVLLNETQFVEAARVLAETMLREGGATDVARTALAFRRLTGRRPTAREDAVLAELYTEQRALFGRAPDQAARLLAIGEHAADPDLDATELAAATVVAQTILNMDASVWKR